MMVDWQERISTDRKVLLGKPVVEGTRLSVELILELLAEGWSHEQLLASYPTLKESDILAVLSFAVQSMKRESVVRIPA